MHIIRDPRSYKTGQRPLDELGVEMGDGDTRRTAIRNAADTTI